MFEAARLKLTAWYLLIIMLISGMFSMAFYQSSTQELQHLIDRVKYDQEQQLKILPFSPQSAYPRIRVFPSITELEAIKTRSQLTILALNGFILVISGIAAYFLAGQTLEPIKEMVEDQRQFITDASHELRTPIAVMRAEMEATLLEPKLTDKQARQLITSNLEELTVLQNLANNLLELSQTSTTQIHHGEIIDLLDVSKSAIKKVQLLAKTKQIRISSQLDSVFIEGYEPQLVQVLVILLENAIKYSPDKSRIIFSLQPRKNMAEIVISDQGIGIAEEDLPYIFNRFYRSDKSRSEVDGYGLGLSIAQKIIKSHKGSISVSSLLGHGTSFTMRLPIAQLPKKNQGIK